MDSCTIERAVSFLQILVNQELCYALKSPDTDLYDFGFRPSAIFDDSSGEQQKKYTHVLHIVCRFKVIWKKGNKRMSIFYEDTPSEVFAAEIQNLIGLRVKKIALSEKNDLWLDFGNCWVVFATFENGEESWRFFITDINQPHLIASNVWLDLEGHRIFPDGNILPSTGDGLREP